MKYEVSLKGRCPLVHLHSADFELEADTPEQARTAALDLVEQGKVEWKKDGVVGADSEIVIDSVDVSPKQ
jgi:hypothetical protein